MLLSDAALSAHEWYFRTISTIRGNLRQIKLLVFLLGRGERVIVKCCFFFFSSFSLLPIKTEATAAFFIKGDYAWVMLISESKPSSSNASHYLLKSAVVIFRL